MKRNSVLGLTALLLVVSLGVSAGAQALRQHSVQAGDTLWKIAGKYDTTVLELLNLNARIIPDNLTVGQKINLPLETLFSYHVIQPGDNVRSLAAQYKVPLQALLEANGLQDQKVTVGEMIRIPMHLYQGEEKPLLHVVEIGDTLYKLAERYQVTLAQLAEWNKLADLNTIIAGETLIVG